MFQLHTKELYILSSNVSIEKMNHIQKLFLRSNVFQIYILWGFFSVEMELFESNEEYIQYHYNSLSASGRINEVVDLVKSQKNLKYTDYNFLTEEGLY